MVLRVTISFLLLCLLPTLLLHFACSHRIRRLWFWTPAIVLLLSALFLFLCAGYVTLEPSVWRSRLLSAILTFSLVETVLGVLLLVAKIFHGRTRRYLRIAAVVCSVGILGLMIYGLTLGSSHIAKREILIADARIPRTFDDYRIAVISDLHLGTHHGDSAFVSHIVDSINATNPDMICIVGDLINFNDAELEEFCPILSRLQATDGVVSVMGNHDYMMYYAWSDSLEQQQHISHLQTLQRNMGWHVLLNEHLVVHHPNLTSQSDSIVFVGSENDGLPPFPELGDLDKALDGTTNRAFRILLSHDPTAWRRKVLDKYDIPLTFSGHTHGMQFALPGGWSPAALLYDEWGGMYTHGQQRLYVTTGIGEVMIPFRLGCAPEVVVCTLRAL